MTLFSASQSAQAQTTRPGESRSLVAINSLVLAPTKISSANVAKDIGNFNLSTIEDALQAAFKNATNSDVAILSSLKGVTKEVLSGPIGSQVAFAKKNNFDGLLLVEIQSFSNRTGSAIGTNQGAKFGLALKVLDVSSGKSVWEGNYFEQDAAAPLISVTGGQLRSPQFRSVENLISEGAEKLGAEFAAARLKTYLAK